jgi:uracil-DNA glycosylase
MGYGPLTTKTPISGTGRANPATLVTQRYQIIWKVVMNEQLSLFNAYAECNLPSLNSAIRAVAETIEMSIDRETYDRAGRDPFEPILFAGSLSSPVAFFARDLGRDEVLEGQPLIGGAGRRVRMALYKRTVGSEPSAANNMLNEALTNVLLTNTVPYKPVGNKAYPAAVRKHFRPYVEALLACYWSGNRIITLGREAFFWFESYAGKEAISEHWGREDRFGSEIECSLSGQFGGRTVNKNIIVAPLPHPSPLNAAYLRKFPELLEKRLDLFGSV